MTGSIKKKESQNVQGENLRGHFDDKPIGCRFPPVNNHEHMCMDGDNLATETRSGKNTIFRKNCRNIVSVICYCQTVSVCNLLTPRGGLGTGTILAFNKIALIIYLLNLYNLRGGLGAGTILAGAGGSSVINSLQAYPDLIKKYQVKMLHRYHR